MSRSVRTGMLSAADISRGDEGPQDTVDKVAETDIKAIWNFTNVKLKVPKGIVCQREDLTSCYAMLSIMLNNLKPHRVKR